MKYLIPIFILVSLIYTFNYLSEKKKEEILRKRVPKLQTINKWDFNTSLYRVRAARQSLSGRFKPKTMEQKTKPVDETFSEERQTETNEKLSDKKDDGSEIEVRTTQPAYENLTEDNPSIAEPVEETEQYIPEGTEKDQVIEDTRQ